MRLVMWRLELSACNIIRVTNGKNRKLFELWTRHF